MQGVIIRSSAPLRISRSIFGEGSGSCCPLAFCAGDRKQAGSWREGHGFEERRMYNPWGRRGAESECGWDDAR